MRAVVLIWFVIYLSVGIYGCINLREGLKPTNLLVSDSYAIPHYQALEQYFWPYGPEVQVVINNAPDLSDPIERRNLEAVVHVSAFSTKNLYKKCNCRPSPTPTTRWAQLACSSGSTRCIVGSASTVGQIFAIWTRSTRRVSIRTRGNSSTI